MERIHIAETKLRGTAPSSVGAYARQPQRSLDERALGHRQAANTGLLMFAGS
jgi:hypothetical protein